ncbi:MAG: AlbA family DNA-binding domain-containing protein, partial [Candidatus Acidiferrales bacterium]
MAQLDPDELLTRTIHGDVEARTSVLSLIERKTGQVIVAEGQHIDFKERLDLDKDQSIAELARDIIAFSNTDGGMILVGATDPGKVVGHPAIDSRKLRERLGPYMGTRIDYETANSQPVINGKSTTLPFFLVRRSVTAYPNLLRKDIQLPGRFGLKVKYLRGSLFYREGKETLVEPTGGDIDGRAIALGFTGAAPRTRSSFLIEEDRLGARLYAHINDRFVGRQAETADLAAKFGDPRGRGISMAGQGGIGKTELAIEVVARLYKSGRFRSVYSGSAKAMLLGPTGAQQADPAFYDFPSF